MNQAVFILPCREEERANRREGERNNAGSRLEIVIEAKAYGRCDGAPVVIEPSPWRGIRRSVYSPSNPTVKDPRKICSVNSPSHPGQLTFVQNPGSKFILTTLIIFSGWLGPSLDVARLRTGIPDAGSGWQVSTRPWTAISDNNLRRNYQSLVFGKRRKDDCLF